MISYHPLENKDIESVRTVQPSDWPDIIPHFEKYVRYPFCYPLAFTDNETLVGTGVVIRHRNTAWLAHIIVHPEHRNKGIGRYIVDTLLRHPEAECVATKLLIATNLGEPVYAKAGFKAISNYLVFKKESVTVTPEISHGIIDFISVYMDQFLEMDKRVSGEDRFEMLSKHLGGAKLFVEQEAVKGFYLPDLGEGLIIAEDTSAGLELLKLKTLVSDKVVLPEENKSAIEFLSRSGFVQGNLVKRMLWGEEIDWKPHCMYSRIGGNLG